MRGHTVERALQAPAGQIADNAGRKGVIVVQKIREGEGNFGWNAATGECGDLVGQGVVDPTKVVRCALENGASIAGLPLTTDALIAEIPEKKKEKAGGHGHMPY